MKVQIQVDTRRAIVERDKMMAVQRRAKSKHETGERLVKTSCQSCHCECGIIVHVKDGKVVKIEGNPDHPMNKGFVCPKGFAGLELLYHPDRLNYPLKRIGERGEGKWKRISWEEALDIMAKEFNRIRQKYGSEAICASVGTQPRGNMMSTTKLANALGSPNIIGISHVCFIPSIIAQSVTYGPEIMQDCGPDFDHTKCMVIWGGNPLVSHPPIGNRISNALKRGARLIVVDPRRTPLASRADLWLQLRPGTDDALVLGMLNVIINEELYDKEFVEKWCAGFDELKERVQQYPPSRVAEITWVQEGKIREAARLYAKTKPAVFQHRVAMEQHTNATQTLRSFAILIAITGNIDVEGGNLIPVYPKNYISRKAVTYSKEYRLPDEVEERRIGAKQFPLYSGSAAPWPFAHKPTVVNQILRGEPTAVKAMFCVNNLILNTENCKHAWEALKKLEFLVVAELFMTPTAELADLVLPAASWLEKDEICDSSYTNYIAVRQKAVEPLYERWSDKKMVFELAKRMNLSNRIIPWKTVDEYNNFRLSKMGITFEDLKKKVVVVEPIEYRKYESKGFNTPSGKVELYSSTFKKYGYDPLPYYQENPESPVSSPELAKEYPLILITGGKHIAFFHSEGRQIPSLRKMLPEPLVEVHPETAMKFGIQDGDWVWIETPRGRAKQKAKVVSTIHPMVVHAQHGWWFPEKPGPEHGCFESNINLVTSDEPPYDLICGAVPMRGLLCRIRSAQ